MSLERADIRGTTSTRSKEPVPGMPWRARSLEKSAADSYEVAKALAAIETPPGYESKTMDLDKSQPPTPDGTGRPANFQTIAPGLYRSSYPSFSHFESLQDLDLKTIVTLVPEELPLEYANFVSSHGIIHHHIPILANKDPTIYTAVEVVHQVLNIMLDPSNYPMLVHCNKGKHRTGCMTACFRKVCGWSDVAAVDEYVKYSAPKQRALDQTFIGRFDPSPLKALALERNYVGGVYKQPTGNTSGSERSTGSMYTNNSVDTYATDDIDHPHNDYQERIRKENNEVMESARLWSYR